MTTVTTETGASESGNLLTRLQRFISDVRIELRKVTWPTLDEVRQSTIAVMITSLVIAAFIFGIDHLISRIIRTVL
jgi:preprotein translocase subunit SecE